MFTTINEKTEDGSTRLIIIFDGSRFIVDELPHGFIGIKKDMPNSLHVIVHRDDFTLPFNALTQVTIK